MYAHSSIKGISPKPKGETTKNETKNQSRKMEQNL